MDVEATLEAVKILQMAWSLDDATIASGKSAGNRIIENAISHLNYQLYQYTTGRTK